MEDDEEGGGGGKGLEAEVRPLKKGPQQPQQQQEAEAGGGERPGGPGKKAAGGGRLWRWRTAAFFLSLFLCLAVVFAFSFVIPCPVRPVSQRAWRAAFAGAGGWPLPPSPPGDWHPSPALWPPPR